MEKQQNKLENLQLASIINNHVVFLGDYRHKFKPPIDDKLSKQLKEQFCLKVIRPSLDILSYEISKQMEIQITKMLVYNWQICNLRVISGIITKQETEDIENLINSVKNIGTRIKTRNLKKNLLIFYFNLMKQLVNNKSLSDQNIKTTASVLQIVLAEDLEQQTKQLHQLEWLIYLLELLNEQYQSFITKIYRSIQHKQYQINFIKTIGLLLAKVLQDKSTTEIIKGYSSHIVQIRQMHYKQSSIYFRVSAQDYQFISQLFISSFSEYKLAISDKSPQKIKLCCNTIMQCLTIFNCAVYFGGYSPAIQQKTASMILKPCVQLLEISYLIYQLTSTKVKKIKLQKTYSCNLNKCLNILGNENVQINAFMLQEGQLTAIIRLLSNIVHINKKAQQYFQQNIGHFRIILSLTHEDPKQLTMKQWAIMFLRNVCEQSIPLRQQIEKTKIDIKVDPKDFNFSI